ncbi:MAG: hypothetical protein M3R24_17540 [Chloroflexota bacterium]|nr:hypothetical protein [Chloroflexota bacterium]
MIRPKPDFETTVARAGFSLRSLAIEAGVSYSTVLGTLRLNQPQRRGGMLARNAWKLARTVAAKTNETEEQAFARLFVEEEYVSPVDGRRIEQTPDLAAA